MILRVKVTGRETDFHIAAPKTVQEAVEAWGEDVVYGMLLDSLQRRAAAFARKMAKEGATDGWIQARLGAWSPAADGSKADPVRQILAYIRERLPDRADREEAVRYILNKLGIPWREELSGGGGDDHAGDRTSK